MNNVLPFARTRTQPLPPLIAPPREPGIGLRVTLGDTDVTKRPAVAQSTATNHPEDVEQES